MAYLRGVEADDVDSLEAYAKERLPGYMVPRYYVYVSEFPLTGNRKIDKQRLPSPVEESGVFYEAAQGAREASLVGIWQSLLGVDRIGVRDNFFDLGGHSLNATRLVSMIYKELGVKIELVDVFSYPTIRDLAIRMSDAHQEKV